MPRPDDVKNAAQLVAVMRQLRKWADVSYRELERRAGAAGNVLPRATLSGALSRQELPREELLAAFVRACGGDESTVAAWVEVRKRLAVEREQDTRDVVPGAGEPSAHQGMQADAAPPSGLVADTTDGTAPHDEPAEADPAGAVGEARKPVAPTQAQEIPASSSPAVQAVPVADPAPGSPATGLVPESSSASPQATEPAPKRPRAGLRAVRRPGVVLAAAAAIVVLTASATGILRPDHDIAEPRNTRTTAPATTISPTSTPSRSPGGASSSAADTKPINDASAPERTRDTTRPTPSTKPTGRREPEPERSTWTPQPPPHEPPPSPYEPAPSTYTPPPAGGGDPFPEETCWDATEDCV